MPSTKPRKRQDQTTDAVYAALKARFPALPEEKLSVVYRLNPSLIRIRVIDPEFDGKLIDERDRMVMNALARIPAAVRRQIAYLLAMTPEEAEEDTIFSQEFDDPPYDRI